MMAASFAPEVQLGLVEGYRLLRNPLVVLAGVVTAVWIAMVTPIANADQDRYVLSVGYPLAVLGFVALGHTMLAVLRSRFHRSEGLLDVLPIGPDRRTIGHALAALAGGAVGAGATAAIVAVLGLEPGGRPWDAAVMGSPAVPQVGIAQLLQGPIAVVVACLFVVALARWIPGWLIIVPVFVLTVFQVIIFGIWFAVETDSPLTWLWPVSSGVVHDGWTGCGPVDDVCELQVRGFDQTTPWWHLAYLSALCAWLVMVAVLRHRHDRRTWTLFGASSALVVALACVQIAFARDLGDLVDQVGAR
jgi:hypothetical protein